MHRPYTTVEEVRADLAATRDRPARVVPSLRLAHLALLGALLSPGLFMMFFFGKSFNGLAITVLEAEISGLEKTLAVLDGGRLRAFVHDRADRDSIIERFSSPAVRRRLADALAREKEDLRVRLEAANVVEWILLRDDLKKGKQLLEPGRAVDLTGFEPEHFLRLLTPPRERSAIRSGSGPTRGVTGKARGWWRRCSRWSWLGRCAGWPGPGWRGG